MKKIILSLGILFTCIVSIRFIMASINQDDFNYIHFTSVSQQTIQNHQAHLLALDQTAQLIQVIGLLFFGLTIVLYHTYLHKTSRLDTEAIQSYHHNIHIQNIKGEALAVKLQLSDRFLTRLKTRVEIINENIKALHVTTDDSTVKEKLSRLQNVTQNILEFILSRISTLL